MSVRTLGTVGLVVAGGVAALVLALRGDDPPPAPEAAGRGTAAAEPGGPAAPPARPSRLPARRPLPPAPRPLGPPDKALVLDPPAGDAPLWETFDGEPRDDAWADPREAAVGRRLGALLADANRERPDAVQVARVECRSATCRLLVQGSDQPAFQHFIESLQDERGFYGDADQLALDAYSQPVDKESGQEAYQVRVHLHYVR